MATDSPMEKINVRVPPQMLEQLNDEYEQRGYTSQSEAIRDAIRDWLNPPATLSDEILEDLAESRRQAESDEYITLGENDG